LPADHRPSFKQVSGNVEHTRPANSAYFPALDGLRAIAFLMVFAIHYLSRYLPVTFGWAGVDVFFVLSGFLITGILFDTQDVPHHLRNFYVRRTLRIFPLYYGLFFLLALLYLLFRWNWDWSWLMWPAYIGNFAVYIPPAVGGGVRFTAGSGNLISQTVPWVQLHIGHFWSLCVEEQFYLVWPWIVFSIKDRKKLLYICLVVIAVCPLLRIFSTHLVPQYSIEGDALYYSTIFRIDAIMFGALVALVRRGPISSRTMLLVARGILVLIAVAVLLWLVLDPNARHTSPGYVYPMWRLSMKMSLADIISACLIIMAIEYRTWTFRALNLWPLRWLGRITYGAYVFHDIPHALFLHLLAPYFDDPGIPAAVLAFVSTLLVAWASFRWFESPFIRLKERWTV
jgi:peptidoglycan/LPS O-acetylase OafA/YrhL